MKPNYESIEPRTQTINELLEQIKEDLGIGPRIDLFKKKQAIPPNNRSL